MRLSVVVVVVYVVDRCLVRTLGCSKMVVDRGIGTGNTRVENEAM